MVDVHGSAPWFTAYKTDVLLLDDTSVILQAVGVPFDASFLYPKQPSVGTNPTTSHLAVSALSVS